MKAIGDLSRANIPSRAWRGFNNILSSVQVSEQTPHNSKELNAANTWWCQGPATVRRGWHVVLFVVPLVWLHSNSSSASPASIEVHAQSSQYADLVLRGGTVATVDPRLGIQEAIAITGYEITFVGTDEVVEGLIGPNTKVVDLKGKFAMPGFIEGHGHFMALGRSKQILDLTAARNWDEIVNMVAQAVSAAESGEWVFGSGWHQDKWGNLSEQTVDGVPLNLKLNSVSPDNPVVLEHASGHAVMANDATLLAAKINLSTPNPPGGTIVRTEEGQATGLLREAALDLLNPPIAEFESQMSTTMRDKLNRQRANMAADEALRNGVTSFQDAGSSFETIDFLKQLESEHALPIRLYVMVRYESNEKMDELLPQYRMVADNNDFLTVRSIKRQLDGALGSHGALLVEPYVDLPNSSGLVLEPLDEIARTGEIAVRHGFQVATHAIGTKANREVLDLYSRVWKRMNVKGSDLRWRVEHAQHILPEDVPRFGQMKVIAAMQGVHCTSDGPWVPTRLGVERAQETSYLWRSLIDSGALIGNGTDTPVEPINPIASFYSSVSRITSTGDSFVPEQSMTRMEAIASYTLNNAIAEFGEDRKGTLSPGKLADIVVLSQNILTIPQDEIPATQVVMTIVGGDIKFDSSTDKPD